VKSLYLPPHSPDFSPIEEIFAELKAYVKKAWSAYERILAKSSMSFFGGAFMNWLRNKIAPKAISDIQVFP
jgi:transposase